jgi:hypothetical protein
VAVEPQLRDCHRRRAAQVDRHASSCSSIDASRARADALANLLLPSKVAPRKRDVVGDPATKRDLLTTCTSALSSVLEPIGG